MDPRPTRRNLLRGGVLALGALAGCAGSPGSDVSSPSGGSDGAGSTASDGSTATATGTDEETLSALSVERVADGFTSPVGVVTRGRRRYVVDQDGVVHLADGDGVRDEPYLDLRDRTVSVNGYSEQGLLGMALHPSFDENGRLFVRYSAPGREGTPDDYSHTFVLSQFRAEPDAATVDPDTERTLLEIPQPQGNHNAGDLAFGPDGLLYVPVGDGGGSDDRGPGHVEDWYDGVPGGNGQDVTENLLGSVLRIDVDGDDDGAYAVPEDNPLVGREGLDEIYAWGLRNPWRLSFGPDGRLFAADVGQNRFEEVNLIERGGNYGWNVREGRGCFRAEDCPTERDGETLIDPIVEYPHDGEGVVGIAVIGGHVYDGSAIPGLAGRYLFADWRTDGRLFVATEPGAGADGDGGWSTRAVDVEGPLGRHVLAFGREPDGELLVCTSDESGVTGSTGALLRVIPG